MAHPDVLDLQGLSDTESTFVVDPLTVNDVSERRANSSKMAAGVAAYASSDLFKIKVNAA